MKTYTHMIALDLDGTSVVYEPHLAMDPHLAAYLAELHERGAAWVMNSDRYTDTMVHIAGLLPDEQKPQGILSCQRYIHMLDGADGYRPVLAWNQQQNHEHAQLWETIRPFFPDWCGVVESRFTVRDRVVNDMIFAYMVPPEESPALRSLLQQFIAAEPLGQVSGNHDWAFILHASFSKARVLKKGAEMLGVPLDRVIAIGDGFNDISMLDGSVTPLVGCPSNAAPEVIRTVRRAGGLVARAQEAAGTMEILQQYLGGL